MRRTIASIFWILMLVNLATLAAITIDPMKIVLDVPPGGMQEGTVTVTNVGEEPTTVSIRLMDFFLDESGSLKPLEPGTLGEASLSRHLEFSPSSLFLEPGASGQASYRLQLQGEAAGSHWGCLIITEEEPEVVVVEEEREGVILRTEFIISYAVTIYQNPPNRPPEPWARVGDIVHVPTAVPMTEEELALSVAAMVENLTDVVLTPRGWVEVREASSGDTVVNAEIEEFTLLPYTQRILSLRFLTTDWEEGNYLFLVVIDCGGETLAANQTLIEFTPR